MIYKQTKTQRLKYVFSKSFIAAFAIALGATISDIMNHDQLRILTTEFVTVILVSFFLAFFFVWLISKKDLRMVINKERVELSSDDNRNEFLWKEVKNITMPSLFRPRWVFELQEGEKIKLSVKNYSKEQVISINEEIQSAC